MHVVSTQHKLIGPEVVQYAPPPLFPPANWAAQERFAGVVGVPDPWGDFIVRPGRTIQLDATGAIMSGVVATNPTGPEGWGMLAGPGDADFPVHGSPDSHRYGLIFSLDEGVTWAYAGRHHTITIPAGGDQTPRRLCLAVNRPAPRETRAGFGRWSVTITASVPDAADLPTGCAAMPPPTPACSTAVGQAISLRGLLGQQSNDITNAHNGTIGWTNALVAAVVAFGVIATIEGALLAAGVAAQASLAAAGASATAVQDAVKAAIDAALAAGTGASAAGPAALVATPVTSAAAVAALGVLSAGLAIQGAAMPWWITLGLVIGLALLAIALAVVIAAIAEIVNWSDSFDHSVGMFADTQRNLVSVLQQASEFCCPGTFDTSVPSVPAM